MLKISSSANTFQFNFRDKTRYADYPQLESIGWQIRQPGSTYYYNCERSTDHYCLFQYTLAGEGRLSIRNTEYRLTQGQAFMLEKPGPYRYWLPADSPGWELIFISFSFECLPYWNNLINMHGHIAHIPYNSAVIQLWKKIYNKVLQNKMNCFLTCSSLAYEFIMMLTLCLNQSQLEGNNPSIIQKCITEIRTHYDSPITTSHLCQACNISPSYLSRIFREQLDDSPMHYLQRYRITVACAMLLRSDSSVSDIATRVGFSDANYFSRVFQQHLHMTPTVYRTQKNANQLLLESGVSNHINVETFSF